jgi:annexin A7/11
MKGLGTDEKAIIQIVANRTNLQRQAMIPSYQRQFNRDLIKDLKSELSGKFEDSIIALFDDPITYDCKSIFHAMKGAGTNEDTLIEILSTRPNYYINQIKQKYQMLYNKSLEQRLNQELSGDLKKVMLTLISGRRGENQMPNQNDCMNKAQQLYKAGEGKIGTNEELFYQILTMSSPQELMLINQYYMQIGKGNDLMKAIDKEFSGNMKKLLQTLVYSSINPSEYFATRIYHAVKGQGTKDTLLMRIVITRDEIDMPLIKQAYMRLYQKDLVQVIKKETSGDYKKLLVELVSH